MKPLNISTPIVSVAWLKNHLDHPNLIILDASMQKPGTTVLEEAQTKKQFIKGALPFDFSKTICNINSPLPNTMPSAEVFTREVQKLGIDQNSAIIVYDDKGIFSSPRAWWMFKVMGHQNIAVLDGGLPTWIKADLPCEPKLSTAHKKGNFIAQYQPELICDISTVLEATQNPNINIVDARSESRFKGTSPEPRKGLRAGHIPNSLNLPYTRLQESHKMLPTEHLKNIFEETIEKDSNLIFSCGSGVTACILALGAQIAGYSNTSVYDGSWSEWGASNLPIEN